MADLGHPLLPLSGLAALLAREGTSSAWDIAVEAMDRQRAGEDIILLTLGDPKDPPYSAIVAATQAALCAGRTHYTPLLGEPELRQAIAARAGCNMDNVVVLPGAQHGTLAAMLMIASPGDEVILSDPYYATYPGVVAAAQAHRVVVPAKPADLAMDVPAIIAAITPRTRAIFLNSPANPSGAALSADDYALLRAACIAHRIWLLVDEVYADFRFDGTHVPAWTHGPQGQTIVVSSLSKSHAMTGYRLGWAVAPAHVVQALGDWSAAALFGVSQFVQDAGLAALAVPAAELRPYVEGFRLRAAHVVARANAIPGLAARMPEGGMFVMLDCRAIAEDDVAFANDMLRHTGVACVPGSGFGTAARGHLRISLTPDMATLDAAFDRIAAWRGVR